MIYNYYIKKRFLTHLDGSNKNFLNWINSILIAIACPIFGSLLDARGQRKLRWKMMIGIAALAIVGTAVIASGGIWVISLVFFAVLHVATELVWLIKASYLGDIAKDDLTKRHILLAVLLTVWGVKYLSDIDQSKTQVDFDVASDEIYLPTLYYGNSSLL